MKLKFKYLLLLSVLTTLTALFASFFAMSDNSGYAGLFFIGLSPIFIVVFIIWTLIISSVIKNVSWKLTSTFLTTIIFEYFLVMISIWAMSSDSPSYNFHSFLSDCADMFTEKAVFFCILTVATVYALLLKYISSIHKVQQPE